MINELVPSTLKTEGNIHDSLSYSRSHGNIAITVIMSNSGRTVNGVFAARLSNVEHACCLTLTGRCALVINFTCAVCIHAHLFLRTAIIGIYACVAGTLTLPDYLWSKKATLDSYSFVIHERVFKDRVKVSYTT